MLNNKEEKIFSPETYKLCAEIAQYYGGFVGVMPIDIIGEYDISYIINRNGGNMLPRKYWYLIYDICDGYMHKREKFRIYGPNIYYTIKED